MLSEEKLIFKKKKQQRITCRSQITTRTKAPTVDVMTWYDVITR